MARLCCHRVRFFFLFPCFEWKLREYFDDIHIIDNPELQKYISLIYLEELQLNKATLCRRETPLINSSITVICDGKLSSI